jgi:hypothetical protein
LLKWIVDQEFSGEFSLIKLSKIPFNFDEKELLANMDTLAICKVLKILLYKSEMFEERQKQFKKENQDDFKIYSD